jgi:hypothetical protein
MRKIVSFILPFIGLAIFAYIIHATGWGRIIDAFKRMRPAKLYLMPLFVAFIILIRGYRWQYLMRMLGIDYSLWRSNVVWTIGFFAAAVTPGKVGDALRAFYVSNETGRNFGECFLSVFMDRLLDLIVVVLFGVVTIIVFSHYYMQLPSLWIIFACVAGLLALIVAALYRDLMKKLLKPVFNVLVPKKYKESASLNFNAFYDALASYVKNWKGVMKAFLLTVVYWVVVFVLAYYTAYVMDTGVSFSYLFIIMPVVTLVELIPISLSGLGTREATVIKFFQVVGISQAGAVGFSIAYLLLGTYLTALIGFFLWLKYPAKLTGD